MILRSVWAMVVAPKLRRGRRAARQRCAADPGSLRTPEFGMVPDLRISTACCSASGTRVGLLRTNRLGLRLAEQRLQQVGRHVELPDLLGLLGDAGEGLRDQLAR